jgi:hypothetical protein
MQDSFTVFELQVAETHDTRDLRGEGLLVSFHWQVRVIRPFR